MLVVVGPWQCPAISPVGDTLSAEVPFLLCSLRPYIHLPLLIACQPDAFYFNALPFAEDIREFYFPPLESLPANQQPTPVQLRAAEELVRSLTVAGAQEEGSEEQGQQERALVSGEGVREGVTKGEPQGEPLAPENTPNAALQVRLTVSIETL